MEGVQQGPIHAGTCQCHMGTPTRGCWQSECGSVPGASGKEGVCGSTCINEHLGLRVRMKQAGDTQDTWQTKSQKLELALPGGHRQPQGSLLSPRFINFFPGIWAPSLVTGTDYGSALALEWRGLWLA